MLEPEDGCESSTPQGERTSMKKLMSLMLGLSLIMGVTSVAFGQEPEKKEKKKKKKKGGEEKKPGRTDTTR